MILKMDISSLVDDKPLDATGLFQFDFDSYKCENLYSTSGKDVNPDSGKPIDRSSRLRPRRTCDQEHVGFSNAFLHNSVARTKHTHTHIIVRLSSRCDWSIRNGAELNGSV